MKRETALIVCSMLLGACSGVRPVSTWVPAACHGATAPFSSYTLEMTDVPGFKEPIMEGAIVAALDRRGLRRTAPDAADVRVLLRVTRIDRDAPAVAAEPVTEPVPTAAVSRFTAHADVEVFDLRDGRLIYKAGMDRDHTISGAVTLHDARAEALVAAALDRALEGIAIPCD
jgi:hypothetical protein